VRVAYVIWSLGLGGAEQLVLRLAAGLDRRRFEPLICCLNEPGAFAAQAGAAGVEVAAFHKRGAVDLRLVPALRRFLRERSVDVVHTHLWGANLWGRLAARSLGLPAVATEHNTDTWKRAHHFAIDRALAGGTRALVAVSHAVREFYESHGVGRGRWEVIHNGVALPPSDPSARERARRALGLPTAVPAVGFVGRLVPAKGPLAFLEVLRDVARERTDLRGVMVGDGPLRAEVAARADALGLAGQVLLAGLRDDVAQLLPAFDALLFCSEREGLSLAMLEAMAAGVPVVASAVGGMPEVIVDGVTGVLIAPGDSASLARHLKKMLMVRDAAQRIGAAARDSLRLRFSPERALPMLEELYASAGVQALSADIPVRKLDLKEAA
jgi:glycosyltransferase involved in cell wall biosynthesis